MKKNYFLIAICVLTVGFTSCSETGLVGPEGSAGPQGKTGDAGVVGAAGKDGSVIYNGNGMPANTIGVNSDYYLDKLTGNLYGPKVGGVWGSPTILRGINGTNGTNGSNGTTGNNGTNGVNGSTTLSGNGTPLATTGIIGDYFLDKTNYLLYGPKTNAGWGIPILLRGADGAQGPTGAAGKDGSIIYSGTGAPVPTIGVNGDYYLDKNTGNLYGPKTTSGWGTSIILQGANGINGTNGSNGTAGANGTNGSVILSGIVPPTNSNGNIGDYYLNKNSYELYGPKTIAGWGVPILLRGIDGAQGPTGPAGADGSIIYGGDYYPDPSLGRIGDYYFGRYIVQFFGPKTAVGWGTGTNLKGADGANGAIGPTGAAGATGAPGANGSTVRNGTGVPSNLLGVNGDFYIDINTYMIYGPKTAGVWGGGTSLKGPGASNLLFETPDNNTFDWVFETSYYNDRNSLRMRRNGNYNDSTSVFGIPASAVATAQNSIMLVYMRDVINGWKQVVEGDSTTTGIYSKSRITMSTASARIIERKNGTYIHPNINKVRLVLVPYINSGVIVNKNGDQPIIPMTEMLHKLNLTDKDFIKLN